MAPVRPCLFLPIAETGPHSIAAGPSSARRAGAIKFHRHILACPPVLRIVVGGGREKTAAEAATKSRTGDNEIDLVLITLALMESDFDLDKVVKRFKGLGEKQRIRDVLTQAEVRIDEVEKKNPRSRVPARDAQVARGHPQGIAGRRIMMTKRYCSHC